MNAAPDKGAAPRATDFRRDIRAPRFAVPELPWDTLAASAALESR